MSGWLSAELEEEFQRLRASFRGAGGALAKYEPLGARWLGRFWPPERCLEDLLVRAAESFTTPTRPEQALVEALLDRGADPFVRSPRSGVCALEVAARQGSTWLCARLLRLGGGRGRSRALEAALLQACIVGDVEMADALLSEGADVQAVCARGVSSLLRMRGSVLRLLERRGGALPAEIAELVAAGAALGDAKPEAEAGLRG